MRRYATYQPRTALSLWAPIFTIGIILLVIVAAEARQSRTWDFEMNPVDKAPNDFSFGRTGSGRMGRWVVRTEEDAPSGTHVLAQIDTDATDFRFPMAVAEQPILADVRLSVRCKPEAGKVDRACGLVVRYQDENNYYLTRANALEQNVQFYKVVDGQRQQLASWHGPVASGAWQQLQIQADGEHFVISWDGQQVMEVADQTFREAGKVGVWTKADSVTAFDDLTVEPLSSQP